MVVVDCLNFLGRARAWYIVFLLWCPVAGVLGVGLSQSRGSKDRWRTKASNSHVAREYSATCTISPNTKERFEVAIFIQLQGSHSLNSVAIASSIKALTILIWHEI